MKMYMPGIDEFPQAPSGFVAGKYHMRYESYAQETAKDGRTYFKIKASIVEGPSVTDDAGNPVEYAGREFTLMVWPPSENDRFPDTSKSKFRNFLEESGIPWDEEGYDPDDFIGAEAMVTLAPDKKNPDMMQPKRYDAV
jgi:hypothetical protein